MQSTTRHSARLLTSVEIFATGITRQRSQGVALQRWTCADCRLKAQSRSPHLVRNAFQRSFSVSLQKQDDIDEHKKPTSPIRTAPAGGQSPATSPVEPETASATGPSSLPSQVERRRWQLSKDMTKFLDHVLARASVAGQHINVYTGTDYSGIETLRKDIIEQERTVKGCHRAVDQAKDSHTEAYQKQSVAQKEIVSLLERKSNWGPTDLERYMGLVRSEHVHDQAVQAAKDTLATRERELEEARATLERLERKQYHEEQIWSDTIRRNSTWVTFGLMGLNIILLLTQILIFEPYRRKKIVREVKFALDEKTLNMPAAEVQKQVDEAVKPASEPLDDVEVSAKEATPSEQPLDTVFATEEQAAGNTSIAAGEMLPEEAVDVTKPIGSPMQEPSHTSYNIRNWDDVKVAFVDLFSERLVQMKQVELTTVALQGAATGVAAMGVLFLVFRPR
ncbi:hypothetical protein B0A50_00390 [Salinomyces thailandicus]|uniref:Sensitive to high expression protein 9, mitochondrial n=1 Tax=Salinomyces thailandicus TaxID=706561 RepID=A0A4U0UGG3_9PEZI|nr:hypothetical protein B0A50_00390 [Salinomyces thailandica]